MDFAIIFGYILKPFEDLRKSLIICKRYVDKSKAFQFTIKHHRNKNASNEIEYNMKNKLMKTRTGRGGAPYDRRVR